MHKKAPPYWQQACRELSRNDKVMAGIIKRYRKSFLRGRNDAFATICHSIIGQQISLQAAASIWQRFEQTCQPLKPELVLRKRVTTLQACGLSQQKALCIKALAKFFKQEKITPRYWQRLDEQEIRDNLCSIKGIGKWTFEMFAIFYLRSPNMFPATDLGLLKAIQNAYGYKKLPSKRQLATLQRTWQPWNTVATWYLWRSIDPETIVY